ncbi:MAG: hypothetical protein F4X13_08435 [Gammaproteobacteria bacterium]|nr:hypothetical protein [Gammaproteobacteria bacterium]
MKRLIVWGFAVLVLLALLISVDPETEPAHDGEVGVTPGSPSPFSAEEWTAMESADVLGRVTFTAVTAAARVDGYGSPPLLAVSCRDEEAVLVEIEPTTQEDAWSRAYITVQVRFDEGHIESLRFYVHFYDDGGQFARLRGDQERLWFLREMTTSDRVAVLGDDKGAVFSLRGAWGPARRVLETCGAW